MARNIIDMMRALIDGACISCDKGGNNLDNSKVLFMATVLVLPWPIGLLSVEVIILRILKDKV